MVRTKGIRALFVTFAIILFTNTSFADEVQLSNGDRLSGNVTKVNQGILYLDSTIVGEIEIPIKNISTFSTDQLVAITFTNNDQLTGLISGGPNGLLQLNTERFGTIGNIQLTDIASIYPPGSANNARPSLVSSNSSSNNKQAAASLDDVDEVILKSGDRLLGTVKSVDHDTLVVNTEFAEELSIDRSQVESFNIIDPVTVIFEGDEYLTGKIQTTGNENLQVDSTRTGASEEFELAEIKSVVRGDPIEIAREEQKVKLSGSLDIGLSTSSGNSNDDSYLAAGELRARTPLNRYTVRLDKQFERSNGDKTTDETFGSIQYDHFLNEKWYLFNSASFEEDEIERLNLRTALSGGLGHQFFERDDLMLSAELGPSYVNEDFDDERDNDYIAARWAIDYEHGILSWFGIFHHQEGLYGLESSEDVVIRTRSGLKFPLGNGFNAKMQANIEWDKSPAMGTASTDKEYIFTLGYGF